jgi:hypothetical protein
VVLARVMVESANPGRIRSQPDAGQLTGQDLIVRQDCPVVADRLAR